MAGENVLNYEEQGGDQWSVGGTLSILATGTLEIVSGAVVTGLAAYTIQAAIPDLTDNGGGAAADGTIGAVTAPTAVTLGTLVGTADNALESIGATNGGDVSGAISNNFKELYTAQLANRLAIVALTDAVKELSTKTNAILASLRLGGAISP